MLCINKNKLYILYIGGIMSTISNMRNKGTNTAKQNNFFAASVIFAILLFLHPYYSNYIAPNTAGAWLALGIEYTLIFGGFKLLLPIFLLPKDVIDFGWYGNLIRDTVFIINHPGPVLRQSLATVDILQIPCKVSTFFIGLGQLTQENCQPVSPKSTQLLPTQTFSLSPILRL